MRPIRRSSKRSDGYRSGLEAKVAKQIADLTGKPASYESETTVYIKPAREHRYKRDFTLPNGIVIECKGVFEAADREKHLLIKEQHPKLDIRFVFYRANASIYPGSKTTHAMWCEKHGFKFSEKLIPLSWFKEKAK